METPVTPSSDPPPPNSHPHILPNHSPSPNPILPLYRLFLSSDDVYTHTLPLTKTTNTTSSIPLGWLNDRKSSNPTRHDCTTKQTRVIALANRKRFRAEERFAQKQLYEVQTVQTALLDLESGYASSQHDQAQSALSVAQAVHETFLAKQDLAQARFDEVNLQMQGFRDELEDVRNQIAQSAKQVGSVERELNARGIYSILMNPLEDTDSDMSDGNTADHSEASDIS